MMIIKSKTTKQIILNDNEHNIIDNMKDLLDEILLNFDDCENVYNFQTAKFLDYSTLDLILYYIKQCFDNDD